MLKIMKEPRTWSQARQPPSGGAAGRAWSWMTGAVACCLAVGDRDGSWISFFWEVDCMVEDFIDDGQK